MNKTALITGASGGIGLELARVHASNGDSLVLVARSGARLKEIKAELERIHKISVHVIEKDLSLPESPRKVYEELKKKKITVDYLINNAGTGDYGMFAEAEWSRIEQMLNLNITALTSLTHLFIDDMIMRGSGKIMNVASTAAFQPGPLMAVYYATKAYVLSFSEAINNEVRDKGITVTALCPGATLSGFFANAKMEESRLVMGRKLPSSAEVAVYGYKAMMKGKTVAIHGILNNILVFSAKVSPRALVVKAARFIQDKRR